jgi:hypothetical protein
MGDVEIAGVPEVAGGDGPAGALVRYLNGDTVNRGIVREVKLPGEEEPALRRACESVGGHCPVGDQVTSRYMSESSIRCRTAGSSKVQMS